MSTIDWREESLRGCTNRALQWALCCCRRRADEAEEVLQGAYMRVLDGASAL